MKKTILLLVILMAVAAGGLFWFKSRDAAPPAAAADAKGAEEEAGPKLTRDAKGNAVITMNDEMQGDMGIQVTNPAAMRMSPEVKGYGRVLDPAPLAGLMNELASAQAAYTGSSNELGRLKALAAQGNASVRTLQAAEAAAQHDLLVVQSAKERLLLSWGRSLTEQFDLPELTQALASLDAVLVRIELPVGEDLTTPQGARIATLSGATMEARYLGLAPNIDPQMQGRGFLFLSRSNSAHLSPGEAVTGYLKVPGEPLSGVLIPRQAVVRTEGAGWVYILDTNGAEAFTRLEIPLDHPADAGYFVTRGVNPGDYIVVSGAQDLLSFELRGQGSER